MGKQKHNQQQQNTKDHGLHGQHFLDGSRNTVDGAKPADSSNLQLKGTPDTRARDNTVSLGSRQTMTGAWSGNSDEPCYLLISSLQQKLHETKPLRVLSFSLISQYVETYRSYKTVFKFDITQVMKLNSFRYNVQMFLQEGP